MSYINFGTKTVDLNDPTMIFDAYNDGFVMTRVSIGHMERVRSIRVNLNNFLLSSENRRILKKYKHNIDIQQIPLKEYDWHIHKIGKDFYETKFGKDVFSANKIKEILTSKFNFNIFLQYKDNETDGYCIALSVNSNNKKILHYAYPFYKLEKLNSGFGMYMMTLAVKHFQELGYKYIYLGSGHDNKAKYKLQFRGIEWFDEKNNTWKTDLEELKKRLNS